MSLPHWVLPDLRPPNWSHSEKLPTQAETQLLATADQPSESGRTHPLHGSNAEKDFERSKEPALSSDIHSMARSMTAPD